MKKKIILGVIFILAIIVGGLVWLGREELQDKTVNLENPAPPKKDIESVKEKPERQAAPGYQIYQNKKFGYSLEIPIESQDGKVFAIEDGDITFFTSKKAYNYDKIQENIKSQKTDYEKVYGVTWAVLSKKVANENEIDAFIKQAFAKKCSYGGKKETSQPGVFDIQVDLGKNIDIESDPDACFLNYMYVIKYNSNTSVIVIWDLGQGPTFLLPNGDLADSKMEESFRFE